MRHRHSGCTGTAAPGPSSATASGTGGLKLKFLNLPVLRTSNACEPRPGPRRGGGHGGHGTGMASVVTQGLSELLAGSDRG